MLSQNLLWKKFLLPPFRWKLLKLLYLLLQTKRFSLLMTIVIISQLAVVNGRSIYSGKVLLNGNMRSYENYKNQSNTTWSFKNLRHVSEKANHMHDRVFQFFSRNKTNHHRKAIFVREGNQQKLVYNKQDSFVNPRFKNRRFGKAQDNSERASSWAVKIPHDLLKDSGHNSSQIISRIADELDLINHGTIGHLSDYFLLVHHTFYNHTSNPDEELKVFRNSVTRKLSNHPHIGWVQHEVVRRRVKRSLEFKDEFFPSQWHLDNLKFVGHDINVTGVWEHNITGKGVTISVIDDGVEWTNPDILDNYSPQGSWDLNSNDGDPMPRVDEAGLNHHGTRCAGEIAAVANEYCAVGVAFGAKVSGIRILDGPMTDSLEAMAFNTKSDINDIYSCSWGPDDNGRTVDGPHQLAQSALAKGVMTGRKGFGSIYVVASGNGGHFKDNCNFDGYANSIFTVTIGAVDELGQMPYYAEQCAAMLAVTYSSGQGHQRNIVTTDWRLGSGTGCTDRHTGTSAAAPLAAGVIALMLEARFCLTWRDIQHLIVYTSVRVDIDPEEWQVNGAGFPHSHKHGFGLLDSWRLVTAAKIWPSVPFLTSWNSPIMKSNQEIPILPGTNLTKVLIVTPKKVEHVASLEHVTVTVTVRHPSRGSLVVLLVSPHGTLSRLASPRKYDKSKEGFTDWTFSTVRCWGENPQGKWKLVFLDKGHNKKAGKLKKWRITFYGSSMTSLDIQAKKRLVKKAVSGRFLHHRGPPCPKPSSPTTQKSIMSSRILKIILLMSGFLFLLALYYLLETLCDHNEAEIHDTEYENTMDITTPEDFDLLDFVRGKLAKDDEERLNNIIEHGSSRPLTPTFTSLSMTDADLEELDTKSMIETPDEVTRVHEFEQRLKFALDQSLQLQVKQTKEMESLENDLKELMGNEGLGTVDVFTQIPEKKKKTKRKLRGILKKPKQYKD